MTRALVLSLSLPLLAGCAGSGVPVVVATADGTARYEGERSLGRDDRLALTSSRGATCTGDLRPTTEVRSGGPAAFAGVRCDDGRIGVLLLSGEPASGGGAARGVMDRRPVSGGWGSAAPGAATAGAGA